MTVAELCEQILSRFRALPGIEDLMEEPLVVTVSEEPERTLRPENDPPSTVASPEYCVTAKIQRAAEKTAADSFDRNEGGTVSATGNGEAYTETPEAFEGTLKEALAIAPTEKGISAVTISAINAVMNALSLAPGVFPAEEQFHYDYADALCRYVTEHYGRSQIVLVGYDGYIVKRFMDEGLDFWTLDMDPDHIAQDRFDHVVVNGAKLNRESAFAWGKIFIVTGSTLCNGTIIPYLDSGKELLFYGITCAGAATLLELSWFSPERV